MYEQWAGLIPRAVKRLVRIGHDAEDAETRAHLLYAEAVLRWVPSRGAFSTFAMQHLGIRTQHPCNRSTPEQLLEYDAPGAADDPVEQVLAAEQSQLNRRVVREILATLSVADRGILRRRFGLRPFTKRWSISELAEWKNVRPTQMRKRIGRIMNSLRG